MPVAWPTQVQPERVAVRPVWATAHFDNPINLTTEVQLLGGFRFELEIHLPKMPPDLAAHFGAFVQAVQSSGDTFSFNLDPWAPGWTPAPGVRQFRFAEPEAGWEGGHREFAFSLAAVEDV